MSKYTNIEVLRNDIRHLQVSKEVQEKHLKESLDHLVESLKPKQILQNTYKSVTGSPKLIEIIVGAILVASGGYVFKKLIVKSSTKFLGKMANIATQAAITYFASTYSGRIKNVISQFINQIKGKQVQTAGI